MARRHTLLLLLLILAPPLAADPNLIQACEGCHGTDGVSTSNPIPTIAGNVAFVIEDALFMFRDGGRPCPPLANPQGQPADCKASHGLPDEAIKAVAAHFAARPFKPAKQTVDPALVATGKQLHDSKCEKCHSDGGSNRADEAGLLKGQWMGYMKTALANFRDGQREQPDAMARAMKPLSDADIKALTHFYASP